MLELQIITLVPSIVLMIGGYLFQKYNHIYWRSPLYFFFESKQKINSYEGRMWVILGLLNFLLTLIFKPTIPVVIAFYFASIILTWVFVFIILKVELNEA